MVIGDDSCSRGRGFESQRHILDGHFFTLICCKNCNVFLKRPKIIEKEARVGPFLNLKNGLFSLPFDRAILSGFTECQTM